MGKLGLKDKLKNEIIKILISIYKIVNFISNLFNILLMNLKNSSLFSNNEIFEIAKKSISRKN